MIMAKMPRVLCNCEYCFKDIASAVCLFVSYLCQSPFLCFCESVCMSTILCVATMKISSGSRSWTTNELNRITSQTTAATTIAECMQMVIMMTKGVTSIRLRGGRSIKQWYNWWIIWFKIRFICFIIFRNICYCLWNKCSFTSGEFV